MDFKLHIPQIIISLNKFIIELKVLYKMSKHAQYNKSTTKFKSANPIFEEWITEWRDEAVARDLQSKHTYTKVF